MTVSAAFLAIPNRIWYHKTIRFAGDCPNVIFQKEEILIMKQQELLAQLDRLGLNTREALGRFMGNEALFLSFVRQLPEKLDFTGILQSLQEQDEERFYVQVHNLKGMAGNLSIGPVFDCAQAILVEFRTSKFQNETKLSALVREAEVESRALAQLIRQYIEEEGQA